MDYDSASSCEGRLRDFEASEDFMRLSEPREIERSPCNANSASWHTLRVVASQSKLNPETTNKSLSSQVMEYYHKYSQNANLDHYFSLPATSTSPEAVKYYYSIYELNPKLDVHRQDCIGEEYNLRSYVPRERRRWVRPPLIGQSSNTDSSTRYVQPLSNPTSPSPDLKNVTPETILEEKNESQEILTEAIERKISSPTSSIASHKPLEWDSGADVGYCNILHHNKEDDKKLSTIERMALARGCSAALRLDPEGTTESGISGKLTGVQKNFKAPVTPDAHSTVLLGYASGSESEIEITPIVKNHLPGIIAGNNLKSNERPFPKESKQQGALAQYLKKEQNHDMSKTSVTYKIPFMKHLNVTRKATTKQNTNKENICLLTSPLKKSTSMNTLVIPPSKLTLKRSQSELNLYVRDKNRAALPLIFNSSSSIATIVNKPSTCDKVIQTSLNAYSQESVGVQVSVFEEEKPPLPKRRTSLQKSMTLILKNPKGTYKVPNSRENQEASETSGNIVSKREKKIRVRRSCSEPSENGSGMDTQTPQPDDAENTTGRANSFEYFPGHVYENVPNGGGSHVSSSDTGRSQSTLPNTSSSINEKLWGDSDSLVRDLERSVNILKSLVDANKCDKEVKKRLIHHVVKRLITAKYTDDKIEHNLEDNIPWNPENARNKVYRTEILEALTKKHTTSDSSAEWNTQKEKARGRNPTGNTRGGLTKEVNLGSSSDKIDKNTDRTENDGRKARMGLRSDDCHPSSNTPTDPEKSESSECFFPQRGRKSNKLQSIFCAKERCKMSRGDSTMTNSTPPDHNRMLLDAVVNNRRTGNVASSNSAEQQVDWRLLTTLSERQFELKRYSNSDSGDSKLVSYAEMEKRNQLIWITNEISHLSNLKKLLEEPRRLEKPARMSPKKSKSTNFRSKSVASNARVHGSIKKDDYLRTNESDTVENSVEEPWSSHCNIATCQSRGRPNSVIRRVKKRNSCAQTATNDIDAHSKTGGEIMSASITQNSTIKLVNTGVQTIPWETSAIPTLIQSEIVHYIKCPAHDALHFQDSYKRNVEATRCPKHCSIQNVVAACVRCLQEQKDQSNRIKMVHANVDHFGEESPVNSETPLDRINGESTSSSEVVLHPCASNDVTQLKQKETKNQINASKSKHTCDCRCETKRPLSKGCQTCSISQGAILEPSNITKCEECQKKMVYVLEREDVKLKGCSCTTVCECEKSQSSNGRIPISFGAIYRQDSSGRVSSFDQNARTKSCECSTDCSCGDSREPETHHAKTFCNCHSNGAKVQRNMTSTHRYAHRTEAEDRPTQTRPYRVANEQDDEATRYKLQNNLKCDCEKDCSCNNRTVNNAEDKSHSRSYNSSSVVKPNYANEANQQPADSDRDCNYCRRCGVACHNAKKCNYHEMYPKPVAYELSFAKEDEEKIDGSAALLKLSLQSRTVNENKTDGCVCNMVKRIGPDKSPPQKDTLQDYLTRNKAEFVSNAETRRQYMSEISHLRLLRKEKRIQLLAMASTSNAVKSSKASSKPTVYAQKKVNDEEMKERLRKRYLRLNEVRHKRQQQEKQEEARRNKLMAKIFCKKLQQKVLRGQVDLSQSVSVISNM
ncbi:uncharacterized protein LOC128875810 [Hylaeus volcanicus]|uniref:uncharacterized protein LOC128875810 n=1 Tax=Hylaeus volcanicus TaxID=313075 RepID=UPI0023B8484E|nr:uncharacterized protein LOC128875810 [Hylaeus volcanicus]